MFAFSLIAIANHFLKSSKTCSINHILLKWDSQFKTKSTSQNYLLVFTLHLSFKTFIYVLGFASKEFSSASHYQHYQTEAGLHPRDLVKLIVTGVLHSPFGISEAPAKLTAQKLCTIKFWGHFGDEDCISQKNHHQKMLLKKRN